MKRIMGTGLVWLAALLLAQTAFAADGGQVSSITLNQVQQNGQDLTMYVNMYDEAGAPVTGSFDPDQFLVSVDGNSDAVTVDSVQSYDPATQGIHYIFTVDVSKTVQPPMMESVRAGLSAFVDQMGPNDTASIITFGEWVTERLAATGDKAAIQETIAGLQANEYWTALYEGVLTAARAAKGSRSAVVVITDGKNELADPNSSPTKDDIFAQLREAQVPLYCVGLNDNNGVDRDSLVELSNATGGAEFDGPSGQVGDSLNRIYAIVSGAVQLHATLYNPDGKSGFGEPSTFMVGFQAENSFISSNELEQIVNWTNVPPPPAEVTPTPVPQISLEIDENSQTVTPGPDGTVAISGLVDVEEGVVEPDALSITVNDEPWKTSLMRNGNGFTFTAQGVVPSNSDQLNVRAVIQTGDGSANVASRVASVAVLAPTATPEPVLTVEMDELGRDIEYEPGKTVDIRGTINTNGNVDPANMVLYVNGQPCEMTVSTLQANQYEFEAEAVLPEDVVSELKVRIELDGTEVRSSTQSLPLVTPSPVPDPELALTLDEESVVYESGQPLTITGNIEVTSGEVDPEDMALYVNSARWTMTLEPMGDGTYSFEASPDHELLGDVNKLAVRVRLESNNQISSEQVTAAVVTPEPPATPAPTARPKVTPPPTAEPTAAPVEDTEEEQTSGIPIWAYAAGGAALLVILAVIILVVVKRGKSGDGITPIDELPERDNSDSRAYAGTVRGDDDSPSGASTVRDGTVRDGFAKAGPSGEDFVNDAPSGWSGFVGGTISLDEQTGGTMRLDDETGGTVRLDEETGGTVRLDEERWGLAVSIEEEMDGRTKQPRRRMMSAGDELTLGRGQSTDLPVEDPAVSTRHLRLSYDGESLFVTDLESKNGTRINGEKIPVGQSRKLESGDAVRIGRTTLTFRFDKPELY